MRAKFVENLNENSEEDLYDESLNEFPNEQDDDYDEDEDDYEDERHDGGFDDYSEAYFKIDKFMPEDGSTEFYDIIDEEINEDEKIAKLVEYIENNCEDEERMYWYFPKNGSVEEFVKFIISHES